MTQSYIQLIINLSQHVRGDIYNMPAGKISDKNAKIVTIVPKELKMEADKIANADGRSLSGWVKKIILEAVEEYNKNNTFQ